MNETLEKPLNLKKLSYKNIKNGENLTLYPQLNKNNYNLKEQLEELHGPTDFKTSLENVNISIGIFISIILFLFFFL